MNKLLEGAFLLYIAALILIALPVFFCRVGLF